VACDTVLVVEVVVRDIVLVVVHEIVVAAGQLGRTCAAAQGGEQPSSELAARWALQTQQSCHERTTPSTDPRCPAR
jgi:hypothetical protein